MTAVAPEAAKEGLGKEHYFSFNGHSHPNISPTSYAPGPTPWARTMYPANVEVELEVTAHDKTHEMAVASSAVWFFSIDITSAGLNAAPPMGYLRERVAAILQANPWLCARYVKANPGHAKRWLYPKELPVVSAELLGRHLVEGAKDITAVSNNYIALNQTLNEFCCIQAVELLKDANANQSCFIVSAVRDTSKPGTFALVLSVNHMLADGATMYALAGMLSPTAEVVSMQHERLPNFAAVQEKVVGKAEKAMFSFGNFGFIVGLISAMIGDLSRGKNRDLLMYEVDKEWLRKSKTEAAKQAGLPYVSTNDVLTSLVFTQLDPIRVGLMEVSLRGKDKALLPADDSHAGNYTVMTPFFRGDASTPGDVRRALQKPEGDVGSTEAHFVARRHKGGAVPGCFGMLSGRGRYVAITNWASIERDVRLPGCEATLHLPMMNMLVPSPFDGAIVWRPGTGRTGLLMFCRKKGHLPAAHASFGASILGFSRVTRAAQKY